MNDNSYEQEFIKNVKRASGPSVGGANSGATSSSKLPLVVSILLAIIVLVESVALIVFAINYAEVLDLYGEDVAVEYDSSKDSPEDLSENSNFTFDNDYNVTAFNLECVSEDDAKYSFTKAGEYKKTDKTSAVTDSGSYSIVNSGAVILNSRSDAIGGEKKIVYYDGYNIMDGLNFYTCDEE